MKTFYKIICEECGNIVEKSKGEVEHTKIVTEGKFCDVCQSNNLRLWRSKV